MVQIVGKYQYVSNENFDEFVKSLGHADLITPFLQSKPVVEVQRSGDKWTIVVTSDGRTSSTTFKLNEAYEEKLPSTDRKYQSITTQEGNNFRTETQVGDGRKIIRLYEFTDTEMKVHLSSSNDDIKATRTYKRL